MTGGGHNLRKGRMTRDFSRLPNIDNPTSDFRFLRYTRQSQYSSAERRVIKGSDLPSRYDRRYSNGEITKSADLTGYR